MDLDTTPRTACVAGGKSLLVLVFLVVLPPIVRADWPTYQHDAARSGVTKESLTFPLTKRWVYRPAQPPRPAWPRPIREFNRMDFDYAPQPVIAGGRVFFGSSADDTVRALDAATGEVKWRFTTGGPIRFAPQIATGRAYVTSDDGCLYCLDAATGKEVWKFRGALKDDQVLGNGRMISRWPCRSGALVDGGVVYVTAGMWPNDGVFVYALDAATGEQLWCNDTSGQLYARLPHNAAGFSGVTPQGYLLAGKDVLLVPTGRSVPAGFDRRTGRLLYYDPQGAEYATQYNGGTWCAISGNVYFNNSSSRGAHIGVVAYSLATGKQRGRGSRGTRRLITSDQWSVYWTGRQLVGRVDRGKTWKAPQQDAHIMAIAGDALLVGTTGAIRALNAGSGKEIWRASVEGEARGVAVADGRLVVTSSTGAVHCFSPGKGGTAKTVTAPRIIDRISRNIPALNGILGALKKSRTSRGYALVVGEPDAQLAEQLAARSELYVLGLLTDRSRVDAVRELLLNATAAYGSRVAVQHLADGSRLPHPPYFANLIVVGKDRKVPPAKELYRVLRPCGGVMCFPGVKADEAKALLEGAGIPEAEISETSGMLTVTRGKLPGAFDWDSRERLDTRVKGPLRLSWFGGPDVAFKTENSVPLAAEGRIFLVGANHVVAVDAYNGTTLWSRHVSWDHNTGIVRPIPRDGTMYHFGGLAADASSVYVHMKNGLSIEFGAATGALKKYYGLRYSSQAISLKTAQTFRLEVDAKHSGAVTVAKTQDGLELKLVTTDPKVCHPIVKNLYTRQAFWENGDYWDLFFDFRPRDRRFGFYGPGAFHVVVVPAADSAAAYPGAGPKHPAMSVSGAKSDTGTEAVLRIPWTEIEEVAGARARDFGFGVMLSSFDGGKPKKTDRAYRFADLNAYGVNNGWATLVLDGEAGAIEPPGAFNAVARPDEKLSPQVLRGRRPWHGARPRRGPKAGRRHPLTGDRLPSTYARSHGCGGFIGSATADFFRSGVVGIYDFADDSGVRNFGGARTGCGIGAMPALGVLFADCTVSHCVCGYNIKCMLALTPAARRSNEDWALFPAGPLESLVRSAALNFGAPGDRRQDAELVWLAFPRPLSKLTLRVPMRTEVADGPGTYRFNSDRVQVANTTRPWIYASGYRGLERAELSLDPLRPAISLPAVRAPKIDGALDDACWDGREHLPFGIGNVKDRVFLRHDAQHLYVAYRSPASLGRDGEPRRWNKRTRGSDAKVWYDDSCEVFLSDANKKAYVHLGVAASGARYDGCCTYPRNRRDVGVKWTGTWESAVVADDKALVIEIAVPWKTLADAGVGRDRLRINVKAGGQLLRDLGIRKYERQVRTFVPVSLGAPKSPGRRRYTVRLHFAEPDDVQPGERVFDVKLQGKVILKDFDVVKEAGGRRRALVKEFKGIEAGNTMTLEMAARAKDVTARTVPIISALEMLAEAP